MAVATMVVLALFLLGIAVADLFRPRRRTQKLPVLEYVHTNDQYETRPISSPDRQEYCGLNKRQAEELMDRLEQCGQKSECDFQSETGTFVVRKRTTPHLTGS